MDTRSALSGNTQLTFGSSASFVITGELARGGSCIVYDGYYFDHIGEKKPGRIKECFPIRCRISRKADNSLEINEADLQTFKSVKQKLENAYRLGNLLFANNASNNFTANTYNIYEANNTLYIVSAYAAGAVLSERKYGSLKEQISVIRTVASAIARLHDLGYLYLDLKPDNIYTFYETTDLIQLFDFDAVLPIDTAKRSAADTDALLAYTRGFAPLEQQAGRHDRIGRQSDVFGIGALLFFLIFGRTVSADDCACCAEYDYGVLHMEEYRDRLFLALTEFFHHTLAAFHPDRYPDMQTVVEKLDALIGLSDRGQAFLYGTRVHPPAFLIGREREAEALSAYLRGEESCIFVTGMGGIGKSSLVRAAVSANYHDFDAVLYINYKRTIKETIADDSLVHINLIQRDEHESLDEYFDRKIEKLREISHEQKILIVIDNYNGDPSNSLAKLLRIEAKLIVIARRDSDTAGIRFVRLDRIAELDDLLALFEKNIGRALQGDDRIAAEEIIECVGGHTLTVELIARQAAFGSMKLPERAAQVRRQGFSRADDSSVDYIRDYDTCAQTIREIIGSLFETAGLTQKNRTLLLAAAMFGEIAYPMFSEVYGDADAGSLRELAQQGWLNFDGKILSVHPVIAEVISQWQPNDMETSCLNSVMLQLDSRLQPIPQTGSRRPVPTRAEAQYLDSAERFSDACRWFEALQYCPSHRALLYHIIMVMPRERELQYTMPKAEEWLCKCGGGSDAEMLAVCDILSQIYCEHGEMEKAYLLLKSVRSKLKFKDSHLMGRLHYLLAGYYDNVLGGNYDAESDTDKKCFRLLLKETDRAIFCESRHKPDPAALAEYLRLKVLLLIRSGKAKDSAVKKQLLRLNALADTLHGSPLLYRDILMTNAWYYTYYEQDLETVQLRLREAYEIAIASDRPALDLIDETLYPIANVYFEWGDIEMASDYLEQGIALCDEHSQILAYQRKKAELLGYLLQVRFMAEDYGCAREIVGEIEALHARLGEVVAIISDEIRNEIF